MDVSESQTPAARAKMRTDFKVQVPLSARVRVRVLASESDISATMTVIMPIFIPRSLYRMLVQLILLIQRGSGSQK